MHSPTHHTQHTTHTCQSFWTIMEETAVAQMDVVWLAYSGRMTSKLTMKRGISV
jgi:hypothetical protein